MQDMMKAGRWRHGRVDPEIHAELMRRAWASYTPEERAKRIQRVSQALEGKPLTPEHLANLRASPANQKGRAPRAYGSQLPRTAFVAEQIIAIREKYAQGMKQEDIAQEFGIGREVISNIVRGVSYKWVQGGPVQRSSGYGTKLKSEVSTHGNTGRVRTPEQKDAHAAKMRELWASGHFVNKKPKPKKEVVKKSPLTSEQWSEIRKKMWANMSPEQKAERATKIAAAKLGTKASDEAREKMRLAKIGKKRKTT
jgi:hypothetical protein